VSHQIGDVVRLSPAFHSILAFIYHTYDDFDHRGKQGVSVITESGADLGGFSYDEQKEHMALVYSSGKQYEFRGVIWVDRDFKSGSFDSVFKKARRVDDSARGKIGDAANQRSAERGGTREADRH
jgi:hypothetical protein